MPEQEYDIIIVGSGSSGGALAARLTERSDRSVLVLEAGPVYRTAEELPEALVNPADLSNALPGGPNNWSLMGSVTDSIQFPIPRGKGLGGSSSINGAYFIRGIRENFDAWARMGNDEWSYEKVLPVFKRIESEKDFGDDTTHHGVSGPIPVKRETTERAPEFTAAFTQAARDLGFPAEPDKNAGGSGGVGVGPVPVNVEHGRRVGTALGYLLPNMSRPNLHVRGNAYVLRVLFEGNRAIGVEAEVDGEVRIFSGGEIVLSAGALRSPQLLMLSGIGPAEHLREKGIDVRVGLPGVGQNLADHPELSVPWSFHGSYPKLPGRAVMTSSLNWTAEGSEQTGDLEILPFVATPAEMMHFARMSRHPLATLKMVRQTSAQLVASQARTMRMPFVIIGLQQEDSRGTVTLASTDPKAPPKMHWNVFGKQNDVRRLREGVKVAAELFQAAPMRGIKASVTGLEREDLASDAALDAWMQSHLFALGHPCCTAKMGPDSDPMAVVDQYGKVYGVEHLRVCDTSVFPNITSRGPNATAIMLGDRMSEFFT